MEEKLRSPKFCAALVLSFFILVSIFFWDLSRAAKRVEAGDPRCRASEVAADLSFQLVGPGAAASSTVLGAGDFSDAARCKREIFRERLAADDRFLVANSLLIAAFFCFAGSLRKSRASFWILFGLGILLALSLGFSDWLENQQLKHWIAAASGSAPQPDLALLRIFFCLKLAALAITGAVLGALWKKRFGKGWRWLIWPLRTACAGSAVALALVIFGSTRPWMAQLAFGLVAFWWLLGMLHCIAVAVAPEPALIPGANRRDS